VNQAPYDRDLLPFGLDEDRAIRTLLDFLRSGQIAERGILAGSSNLTRRGRSLRSTAV
jgi:hypothetical protein